jgi:pimeloyl-ACP methyl ester carboxylesterase
MIPTLFGDSDAPLFGVLHEPAADGARDHGVVLCPPIGQEYVRSHWAMRQLALSLTRAGFACLRFDWYGIGDSAGEIREASMARWRADVKSAASELFDTCGVRKISLVGLRFGAAVALAAASQIKPAHVVLWDPVLDGRSYIRDLRRIYAALLADRERYWPLEPRRPRSRTEIIGYEFGEDLLRDIEAITPDLASDLPTTRVCVLVSTPGSSPSLASFEERLRERKVPIEIRRASLAAGWDSAAQVETLLLPSDAVRRITDYLEGRAS